MLKTLTLIGMMFVGNIFAAAAAVSSPFPNDVDTQLQHACKRATNAATFETMAAQSVMAADDVARGTLNTSLVQRFEQMERDIGASPLFSLKTIETQENATLACSYYRDAKSTFSALIRTLTEQRDAEEEANE